MSTGLVGRLHEMGRLESALKAAEAGNGTTILVRGEAGMGKTMLVEGFLSSARGVRTTMLEARAESDRISPFHIFSQALKPIMSGPLFEGREFTSFSDVFALDREGKVQSHVSSEAAGMDEAAFTGMLRTVQGFIRDTFDESPKSTRVLGRIEFGELTVITEHEGGVFVTGVFKGPEHTEMRSALKKAVRQIVGRPDAAHEEIAQLAQARFHLERGTEHVSLENERIRIADKALRALVDAASEETMILILEDIQWADDAALFVLEYLARNIKGRRVLQVCTMRPADNERLDAQAERMIASGSAVALNLRPFCKADISAMAGNRLKGRVLPAGFIDSLAEMSGGNPMFVSEMLVRLEEGAEGPGTTGGSSMLPNSLEEIARMRLDALDPASVKLVEYASCLGTSFDTAGLLSLKSIPNPETAMAGAVQKGILAPRGESTEFVYAMYREMVYRDISSRWKAAYHKELGEYFEAAFAGDEDTAIYELARHFSRSAEHAKAHHYCLKAGNRAEAEYAPIQALEMYALALGALKKMGGSPDLQSTARLMERMGDVHQMTGKQDSAIESYKGAAERYDDPSAMARVLRKTADVLVRKGDYNGALASLAEAEEAAGSVQGLEYGRVLLLQGEIKVRMGEKAHAAELLAEANRSLASAKSSPSEMSNALNQMGVLHFRLGNMDQAMDFLQQSLDISQSIGNRQGMSQSLNNLALIHFEAGRLGLAIECFNESLQLVRKMGNVSLLPSLLGNLGTAHYLMGDTERSLAYQSEALELRMRFGQKGGIANVHLSLGLVHLVRGELDQALEQFTESRDMWAAMGERQALPKALINIGEAWLMKGNAPFAEQAYSEALSAAEGIGDTLRMSAALSGLASAKLAGGDPKGSFDCATRAVGCAVKEKSMSHEGNALRALGTACASFGDAAKAEEALKRSMDLLAGGLNKGELALSQYEYGQFLASSGRAAEAKDMLGTCLETFEARGMGLWAARARAALAQL